MRFLAYPRRENCFTVANGDERFAFGDTSYEAGSSLGLEAIANF